MDLNANFRKHVESQEGYAKTHTEKFQLKTTEEICNGYEFANPIDLHSTQLCPLEEKNIEIIGVKEMYDKFLKG